MRSAEPLPSAAMNTRYPSVRSRVSRRPERVGVADDRIERGRGQRRRVGTVGRVEHGHGLRLRVREQPLERQREPRRGLGIERRAPRLLQRLRRARPPRRAAPARGRATGAARTARRSRSTAADRAAGARRRLSHGSHDSMPSKVWPSARRSHCSEPHGCVCQQLGRARPHLLGREQLAHREDPRVVDVDRRALVGHRELRQPVDLVAPQVDAHRMVGGRRVHVDDRAAHRELTARLDLVLAPVAHRDELLDERVTVELRARRCTTTGSTASTCGPSRCTSARTGATTTAGRWSPPTRSRQITRRRRPIVSIAGDTRSNGSVSHAGNSSTASAPRNSRRSAASRSASLPVGTASTTGRRAVVGRERRREQRARRHRHRDRARRPAGRGRDDRIGPSSVVSPARAGFRSCEARASTPGTRSRPGVRSPSAYSSCLCGRCSGSSRRRHRRRGSARPRRRPLRS